MRTNVWPPRIIVPVELVFDWVFVPGVPIRTFSGMYDYDYVSVTVPIRGHSPVHNALCLSVVYCAPGQVASWWQHLRVPTQVHQLSL